MWPVNWNILVERNNVLLVLDFSFQALFSYSNKGPTRELSSAFPYTHICYLTESLALACVCTNPAASTAIPNAHSYLSKSQ
jgi:hypothetical protein